YHQQQQPNVHICDGKIGVAKKYYVTEKLVHYKKMPDRFVPVVIVVHIVVVLLVADIVAVVLLVVDMVAVVLLFVDIVAVVLL
ncbi:unnamed protein product, partial [Rotaria sp. Silwood1]